jgi:hypothetical protein
MRALRNVQEYVNATAKDTGESVGLALDALHVKTKGAPVFDFQEAVDIGEAGLKEIQAADPAVATAIGPSIKKLQDLIAGFRATGATTGVMGVSAKVARARIRALDELVSYSGGGVRQVESDAVGKIIKNMRHALNEEMKDVAATTGYTKLAEANSAHSAVMNAIDELGGVFRTRTQGTEDLVNKFRKLETKFNRGGVDTEVFQELASKFPAVQKSMDDLLDNAAAMTFTRLPQGTPSGFMKDSFRVLTHPRLVGAVVKGSQALAPGAAGIAAGVSTGGRYEKPMP